MRPVLFHWRAFKVWSYPTLLYAGCVCGILGGHAAARASGLDAFRVWVATFALIGGALVGARLLFVVMHWSSYRNNPGRVWKRTEGGAAQYGGLMLALPASWPLLVALGLPFGAFWDVGMLTILIGMIFTRFGCLLNGCCAGRTVRTFGLNLPNHLGVCRRRVPTQVLEAAFAAVLLFAALSAWPRLPFPGALFLLVAGSYATGRMVLESARERAAGEGAFTVQHGISLFIMVAAFTGLSVLWPS
jgi:phosphatidylglycerol:prolipoprotein diacylglycerol transferase